MTDPAFIVRNFSPEPTSTVYRHYKGSLHRVLHIAKAKEVTDPPEAVVTYVSLATGEIFTRPLYSETLDAWTDGIIVEDEITVQRYEAVGVQPIPEPEPPLLQPIDVIRICRQLQTATMALNTGWYYDVRERMIVLLNKLGTPAALAQVPVLHNANPDVGGESFTETDHQALYGAIADALILEAGITDAGV